MEFGKDGPVEVCSRVGAFVLLLVLVVALGTRAQQSQGAGTASEQPSAATPKDTVPPNTSGEDSKGNPPPGPPAQTKPTLGDLSWLAGRWQGAWGPRVAQQVWMPARGNVMVGVFQLVDNGQTLVIELYTMLQKSGEIDLYFRHFTPTLSPWEASKPALLKLASSTPRAIEFDNPVDGQPKRQIIRRIDPDTYVSHSEIVPDKGNPQVVEIIYHRQKEAPAKH